MFVAPRYKVLLEDVVADRHLAPISLQDFEDYLQHVEGTPENLYFHLWMRNYRRIYHVWTESVLPAANIPSSSKGAYRSRDLWERLNLCQDRQLKDEFAFAKAKFFQDGAPMKLGISEELRQKVLFISNLPPQEIQVLTNKLPSFPSQPEPGHFDAVLDQVNAALAGAFERFVRLAFCNSGLWHSCLGHLLGMSILASGLALWCLGVLRLGGRGRGYIAGSLPLIWVGVWFMLVSAAGHCVGVYFTGDARQLYPYELARPLPPDATPPPIYSLERPLEECPPPYASAGKPSLASTTLLPFISTPMPQPSYQPWAYLNAGRRKSEGVLKMFGWRGDKEEGGVDVEMDARSTMDRTAEMELKLPPPRRTKDLPRGAFGIELPSLAGPSALPPAVTALRRGAVVGLQEELVDLGADQYRPYELPDSPGVFTEENDFGIVVSEAFDEDEPYPYTTVPYPISNEGSSSTEPGPTATTLEPLAPLVPGPEYAAQRRMTTPDIFALGRMDETGSAEVLARLHKSSHTPEWVVKDDGTGSRRGSRDSQSEGKGTVWPWPRRLLGPMTMVRSPVVRRAHWAVTVRAGGVALVVTLGMVLGFVW